MNNIKQIILISALFLQTHVTYGYNYQLIHRDHHKIHVVVLDPKLYQTKIVTATNTMFGRKTTDQIAKDNTAEIAINAGFFALEENGYPVGTLVADNKIFKLTFQEHSCFIIDSNGAIAIKDLQISPLVDVGNLRLNINSINHAPYKNANILYTEMWSSAIPSTNRLNILIDNHSKIVAINDPTITKILPNHYILSLSDKDSNAIDLKDKVRFHDTIFKKKKKTSLIKGLPLLISNGTINQKILTQTSTFFTKAHARTAIGIKKDGKIVIIVAEHDYNYSYTDTLNILQGSEAAAGKVVGLNMLELAELMLEQKCVHAINMDGGGSSTLFLKDSIVNLTIGDEDEFLGTTVARPVTNAIVFIPKP
jgi:exopolysaccharide biosynthesis protein